MTYSGKLYPDGTFGLSRTRRFKPSPPGKRKPPSENQRWWLAAIKQHGIVSALEFKNSLDGNLQVDPTPIGSSRLPNSHNAKRGVKGITSLGRKSVKNAAYLLEQKYSKDCISFFTLTLPALDHEEWEAVLSNWAEVIRYLLTYLQRFLEGVGLPRHVVYVVELQEERSQRDGVPALHVHGIFVGRSRIGEPWKMRPVQLREIWRRCLNNCCGLSLKQSQMASTEQLVRVKKSSAAYLAKYLSKGSALGESLMQSFNLQRLVASWWGLSSCMRKWLKRTVLSISTNRSTSFVNLISTLSDTRSTRKEVIIQGIEGRPLGVGYYGRLRGKDLEAAIALLAK